MRSIYLIVFFGLTACGHTQPSEVEIAPKQETKNKVPKGKNVLAVLGCVGGCKSALDEVLNSAPNPVPAEKAHTLEKKTDVKPSHGRKFAQESGIFAALKGSSVKKNREKSKHTAPPSLKSGNKKVPKKKYKVLAILGRKNSASKSGQSILAKLDEVEHKAIRQAGDARPFGKDYPAASTDGCDNLAGWDKENVLSKRIVDSMQNMLKDKNTDCLWSKRFLQCGGALVVLNAYNNAAELQIAQVQNIYNVCQE
ncbi:MAG: hypothetical protein HOK28_07215 [Deltaproteobacteria bacterium]|nr:hypothetical protein [Deltaproteobacteria bacterium]